MTDRNFENLNTVEDSPENYEENFEEDRAEASEKAFEETVGTTRQRTALATAEEILDFNTTGDSKMASPTSFVTADGNGEQQRILNIANDLRHGGFINAAAISSYLDSPHHPSAHTWEYRARWLQDRLNEYNFRPAVSVQFNRGHWHETHAGQWIPHSVTVRVGNHNQTFEHPSH